MQRSERDKLVELGEHSGVYPYRRGVVRASMHDAVPDRGELRIARIRLQPLEQEFERTGVLRRCVFAPFVLADDSAARISGAKERAAVELL